VNRNLSPVRYLPLQARDVATGPLALFAVVSAMLVLVAWRVLSKRPDVMSSPEVFVQGTLTVVQTVAVLFAAGGVAGVDIQRGFYRAWFSKPITPWFFYLQRWLLGGVAVLLIPVMLGVGMTLTFGQGHGLTAGLFGNLALAYLLIGSLILLCGNFLERDWLVAFLIAFAQARLHDTITLFDRMGETVHPAVIWTDKLLPPFHLVDPSTTLLTGSDLVHVIGYGGGMLVAALLLLKYRPLGSGGRA
jgi:hypothetical protein